MVFLAPETVGDTAMTLRLPVSARLLLARWLCSLPLLVGMPIAALSGAAHAQTPTTPPAGYVLCAPERGQCSFSGSASVVYGAQNRWTAPRTYVSGVACHNATFGDPLPFVVKACYQRPAETPAPPAGYSLCAAEGGTCGFTGTASVVYGARTTWTVPRGFSSAVSCRNATFGDPLPFVVKACYFKSTEPLPLRTLYVNGACPTSGNGSSEGCGGANGALRTLGAAHALALPGDLIRVRAGSYDERIVFSRGGTVGNPVRWQTHGDGPVIWVNTNTSTTQPGINDWTGALIYAPASPGASHVRFEGGPGSEWVFQGADSNLFYAGAIVLYGDAAASKTTDWTFRHVIVRNGTGRAGTLAGWRYTFEDFTVTRNGSGFTVLAAANAHTTMASRPWSGHVFRRGRMTDNRSGGNNDGLIIQDVDGVLVEDSEFSGQYDGFDSGSQTLGVPGAPGPRWVIARFNRATGSNGVMPASTVHQGPVTMVYNAIHDNGNWGAVPVYEGSGNVHLWHNTFVNNATAVNFQAPTTGPLHFVNNLCVAGANSTSRNGIAMKICLDGNGQTVISRSNHLAGTVHHNPSTLDGSERSGAADSVAFADDSRYYPLATPNPALVDRGDFFFRAAQAGANTTTLVTGASYAGGPTDPRTFFWVGDTLQIAGVGTRTVVAISATTITLDAPASFPAGAGVHYPFNGSAPDLGRSEWGRPRR
jgi:Right handed beta helix region